MVRLVFNNADATPKTEVVECSAESVGKVMAWYGAYFAGDKYTVACDGRNVRMDRNGEPINSPSGDGCAAMTTHQPVMTEDRVAKAIELLERIAAHDHQNAALGVLATRNLVATPELLEAYADCLMEVAKTDIQAWAQLALLHLRGEDQ